MHRPNRFKFYALNDTHNAMNGRHLASATYEVLDGNEVKLYDDTNFNWSSVFQANGDYSAFSESSSDTTPKQSGSQEHERCSSAIGALRASKCGDRAN